MPNLTTLASYGWQTDEHFGRVRILTRETGVGALRRCVWFERSDKVYVVLPGTRTIETLDVLDTIIAMGELLFGGLPGAVQAAVMPGLVAERNRIVALMRLGAEVTNSGVIQ